MAMRSNFYYQGQPEALGGAIGHSLARALFGDPEMAQAQQEHFAGLELRRAQAAQADAHARLYGNQADGVGIQNSASQGLPGLIAQLTAPQPIALNTDVTNPAAAPIPDAGAFDPVAFRAGLPAVIASLAQMKGDQVNLAETVGSLGAFLGNDEFARRSLIAQGKTPGEDFALTSGRADEISARDAGEEFREATSVARINHATDIPVANIKAGADRDVARINGDTDRDVQGIKNDGSYDRAGAIALGNSLGRVTSTVRSAAHNKKVGGVANSYHLDSRGGRGIDIARAPGVSHADVVAKYRAAGFTILENLDEGDHSHLALGGGPGKAKAGKAAKPTQISSADREMVVKIIDERTKDNEGKPGFERYKAALTRRALQHFQRTGNPDDAVAIAMREGRGGGNTPSAPQGGNAAQLRAEAQAAIQAGAPRDQVSARFKQMTGQNL